MNPHFKMLFVISVMLLIMVFNVDASVNKSPVSEPIFDIEQMFVGKPDGEYKIKASNGYNYEINLKNGKLDGDFKVFNEKWQLLEFAYYEDGKIQGTAYVYDPETGEVIREMEYKDDVLQEEVKSYNSDGNVDYSEDKMLKAIKYEPLSSYMKNRKERDSPPKGTGDLK